MKIKLTLKLEQEVIEKARTYARARKTSLPKLIEHYLQKITEQEPAKAGAITPLVKSLTGIIQLPDDADEKSGYGDYLSSKYQ